MEEFQDSKDIETSFSAPTRLHALFHLFLGFVFFGGFLITIGSLAVFLCSYLLYGDFRGMSDSFLLLKDLKENPYLLKLFVVMSSSMPFIVTAFVTLLFVKASPKVFLLYKKPKSLKWFFISLLFVFCSIPLMGLMLDINGLIDFSQWPDFHNWLVTQEASSNELYEAMIGDVSTVSFVTSLWAMALVPAIVEEVFFRGFLMNVFNGLFQNIHVAIFVTALIFSLLHMQFMKVLPMFFLAVVFGYAAYWSGTIWTSIIAHFINNTLAVSQLYFFTDGDYDKALEQSQGFPPVVNILLVLVVVGLFIYTQRNATSKPQNHYV